MTANVSAVIFSFAVDSIIYPIAYPQAIGIPSKQEESDMLLFNVQEIITRDIAEA